MSVSKMGTSYTSFSYLDRDRDYRAFELADQIDRVPAHHIALTDEDEARTTRLIEENILISLHEHLGVMPADVSESKAYTHEGRMATAFDGLQRHFLTRGSGVRAPADRHARSPWGGTNGECALVRFGQRGERVRDRGAGPSRCRRDTG